ncbi:GATA zinc finger domain-containing protein 14-like [Vigna unguiculata]|uniref:GATA zinc finger domain-containing protein 14-like n=1 Tax=Vigna unguiculata TaxID=3917 RepID=UPI001016E80E|nr:GATA zinc finger domain-containing protein 14-like [Vigna unguiculata]
MASFGNQLSFFLLFLLLISPQIQARKGKVFSLFSHFRTIYNVKDPLQKTKLESPALAPGPVTFEPASAPAPVTFEPVSAPALEPASAPAPSVEQAIGSTIPSGPAPEPEFSESGEGYGLYGRGSYNQYSPTKDTPTTTNFELLNEDFNDESYKKGYPKTNFYSSSSDNNNEEFRHNVNNNEEFRNNANNNQEFRHNVNYNEEFRNNANNNEEFGNNDSKYENFRNNVNNHEEFSVDDNNDEEFSIDDNNNEEYRNTYTGGYASNFNNDERNYQNNNYNGNGYKGKREGMSDTRFVENGRYSYNVNSVNENYNLNGYESERGNSAVNEGYREKSEYPNEFDTMEEYEKQQREQGYTP